MPQGHKCKGRRANGTILGGFALTKWGLFPAGQTPKPKRKKVKKTVAKVTKRAVSMTPSKKKTTPAKSRTKTTRRVRRKAGSRDTRQLQMFG